MGPKASNCLFWAVARKIRRGGRLRFRRSYHNILKFHVIWSKTGKYWWGYSPLNPRNDAKAFIHGCRFQGHVIMEPATPPYDPMTPSVEDYKAAQKDVDLAVTHSRYLQNQTKDKAELQRGQDAAKSAFKKLNDIKARMPKGTK